MAFCNNYEILYLRNIFQIIRDYEPPGKAFS